MGPKYNHQVANAAIDITLKSECDEQLLGANGRKSLETGEK